MAHITPNQTLQLIVPGISAVFALGLLCMWIHDRKLRYVVVLSTAFLAYTFGSASQILHLPDDWRASALVSATFYTLSMLMLAEGVLRRWGLRFPYATHASLLAGIAAGMYYFSYVYPNLVARIYILNFSAGLLVLAAVARIWRRCNGRVVNYTLVWVLSIFGLSFLVRTPLTLGHTLPGSPTLFGQTSFWIALQVSLALFAAVLGLTLLAAAMSDVVDHLVAERDFDPLTETMTRRAFERQAARQLADLRSHPIALVIFDIDHFKSINDQYGHAAGDAVLRGFGQVLRRIVRPGDIVARIGGEEFVALLPGTDLEVAYGIAERLRTVLETMHFDGAATPLRVTASAGVAQHRDRDTVATMLSRADDLLYTAKRGGRNRVVFDIPAPEK